MSAGVVPISLSTLVRVELRKLVDTRAGFWLVATLGLVTGTVLTILLLVAKPGALGLRALFTVTVIPQGVLLPLLGIIAVTTEWSQRTGLVTFVLEPRRQRVAAAKLFAAVVVAVLAMVLALLLAAAVTVLAATVRDGSGSCRLPGMALAGIAIVQVLGVAQGVGFGMVIMNTPAAIVGLLVVPTAWSVLVGLAPWLHTVALWADMSSAQDALIDGHVRTADWLHLASASTLWVLLPISAGVWRLAHREIA